MIACFIFQFTWLYWLIYPISTAHVDEIKRCIMYFLYTLYIFSSSISCIVRKTGVTPDDEQILLLKSIKVTDFLELHEAWKLSDSNSEKFYPILHTNVHQPSTPLIALSVEDVKLSRPLGAVISTVSQASLSLWPSLPCYWAYLAAGTSLHYLCAITTRYRYSGPPQNGPCPPRAANRPGRLGSQCLLMPAITSHCPPELQATLPGAVLAATPSLSHKEGQLPFWGGLN